MILGKGLFSSENALNSEGTFKPQLTSLIDVMVFMIVFLIKSFSVEGDLVTPAPDLELPVSTAKVPPKPTCSIEISKKEIIADGKVLSSINTTDKNDSMLITSVYKWGIAQKAKFSDTLTNREILIQADREIEFSIIKRVMYSCSKAGLTNFLVLAVQEG